MRIGFGERMDAALGREAAIDFLKAVLRISSQALLEGKSARLVRDRVEAELVRRLERVDSALLAFVVRQAGLAHDIAAAITQHISNLRSGRRADGTALARRARQLEEKADRILIEARNHVARFEGGAAIEQLVDRIEEAIDEIEQAAFIASLLPGGLDQAVLTALRELCDATMSATCAVTSGTVAAAEAPEGRRADSEDVLAAVARLVDVEHAADSSEREVTALVFRGDIDLRAVLSTLEFARALERATDRMAGFGHVLSRHVLEDLSAHAPSR
jgi:uncharacterized protein Yka (UPF0111/DUF47 family)